MKVNIPWFRYALIAELADRLKDISPQFGKTVLQKIVFLLQELYHVNLGYRFDLYMYGPFSTELLQDLDLVESLGGVSVEPVLLGSGGYQIRPGVQNQRVREKAKDFLKKISDKLDKLLEEFGKCSAKELELYSTIFYVSKELMHSQGTTSRKDLARIVNEIKPKFFPGEIQRAIDELVKKGYLSFQEG